MKIAFDCRSIFKGMGGIGRYALSLLNELAAIDQENEYVCYFTHLDHPEPFEFPARFERRVFQAGMIDERFDQLILPTLLAEDRIDLYHNPTFAVPVVRGRARTIATVHDVVFRRHPELVEPRLRDYLDRATQRACRHAHGIITVSEFSKREILDLYSVSPARVAVIHNGVELPRGGGDPPGNGTGLLSEAGLEPEGYVLYVGAIEEKKNLDLLIRGFQAACQTGLPPSIRLALAGARNSKTYPLGERLRDSGIGDRVRVLGYVPADLLEVLYAHAFAFVYPSLYEGFGFPPLEAMARGIPTIVSDASSLPEVVGDAAIKVDPGQPERMAEAIRSLALDPSVRQEFAARGPRRAAELTWHRSALRHLELYQSVMKAHESPTSCV